MVAPSVLWQGDKASAVGTSACKSKIFDKERLPIYLVCGSAKFSCNVISVCGCTFFFFFPLIL